MSTLFFILIFLANILTPASALAGNDLIVSCEPEQAPNTGFCETTPADTPLFDETNWLPGNSIIQTLTVQNKSFEDDCDLYLSADAKTDSVLKSVLENKISRNSSIVHQGTMAQLLDALDPIFLETIPTNQTYIYNWQVAMDTTANNDYQDLSLVFDLNLHFTCGIPPEPTPTPNPYQDLVLNEIFPNPCDETQEWVEIHNASGQDLDISAWGISDATNIPSHFESFATGTIIPTGGFSFLSFNSIFNNTFDYARLFNNFSILWDTSQEYPNTTEGISWSRQPDGTWCPTIPTLNGPNGPCLDSPVSVDCGEGDNGGTGGDDGSSACTLPTPDAPSGLTAFPGGLPGEVLLSWTASPDTLTHYTVLYGPAPGDYVYGNWDIGITTTYTVSGLVPGESYYFTVMAVNDCAPGPYAEEVLGTATSGASPPELIPGEPAAEFEQIRGATTGDLGQEAGVSTEVGCCPKLSPWWWILLLFELFFLTIFYHRDDTKRKNTLLIHILLPTLLIFLHIYLRKFFDTRYDFSLTPRWTSFFPLMAFMLSFIFYPFEEKK